MATGAEKKEEEEVWLAAKEACTISVRLVPHPSHAKDQKVQVVHGPFDHLLPFSCDASLKPQEKKEAEEEVETPVMKLTVECREGSRPLHYQSCLKIATLKPEHVLMRPWTVDSALKILNAAEHLHYQEAADLCMKFLAAAPSWSEEQEAAIRSCISAMNHISPTPSQSELVNHETFLTLKPSLDLLERLDSSQDTQIFKDFLLCLAYAIGNERVTLEKFVKETFSKVPSKVKQLCTSMLLANWESLTDRLSFEGRTNASDDVQRWISLTNVLLQYDDTGKEVVDSLVLKSKSLSVHLRNVGSFADVLASVFRKILPDKSVRGTLILLPNSQRASLAYEWAPTVLELKNRQLFEAFRDLVSSLPLQHPLVIKLVHEHYDNIYFQSCFERWRTSMFKRMHSSHIDEVPNKKVKSSID